MNFRSNFPWKKYSKKILLAQKNRREISGGLLGVVLIFDFIFWSGSPKNTLLYFERQKKDATVKKHRCELNKILLEENMVRVQN